MSAGWWSRTRRRQQRFDVVGVEDSEQVVKGADEPAAAVREHLHQLLGLQEAFFCALHLRKEVSQRRDEHISASCFSTKETFEYLLCGVSTQNLLFTGG